MDRSPRAFGGGPHIDDTVNAVLARTRVAELATLTARGVPEARPLSPVWLPDRGRIEFSTPLAYSQKVRDMRRDPRVAVLFSDPTNCGLDAEAPAVLVKGTAYVPDVAAGPQDMEEYWSGLLDRNPSLFDGARDPGYRRDMVWYYWRLPIHVTVQTVQLMSSMRAGGRVSPQNPGERSLSAHVQTAIEHYPTAVFGVRDETGHPILCRATVRGAAGLALTTARPVEAPPGPASLLWHRHNGETAMTAVTGDANGAGVDWRFEPRRLRPDVDTASHHAWIADAKARSLAYLAEHRLEAPPVDWDALVAWTANRGTTTGGR